MHKNSRLTGKVTEEKVCSFLQKQGLKLITKNFYSPYGEIDLIMKDQKTLIFVEIRFRNMTECGEASETIDKKKQNKIIKTALLFLQKNAAFENLPCRFDVITVTHSIENNITWIKDAFQVQ